MSNGTQDNFTIIIVGAGPSGILLALLLAKTGVKVTVLEKADAFDKQPRASFYAGPAQHELKRAGVLDEICEVGFHATGMSWRHLDGTYITGIDQTRLPMELRQVSLPLTDLIPLMARHLGKYDNARVLFEHEVVGIGQDGKEAWVDVKTPVGDKKLSASYIVGCDGGTSKIRRELLGRDSFPGMTWPNQIVATNVYYPRFQKEFLGRESWTSSTFFVSPEYSSMVAQMSNDGLLRITYQEDESLSREEMQKRLPEKFKAFVPGSPDESEYEVVSFSPYRIHQRCAERLRLGRFVLAADAAHLCNPYGGMGLTGGFADVGGLYDCLYGIYTGRADDSILDKYDDIRREKYWSIIDPISTSNLKRLMEPSPEAVERDEFFSALKKAAAGGTGQRSRDMLQGVNAVMYDFTQHYKVDLERIDSSITGGKA